MKVHNRADQTLKLLNMFERGGVKEIENFLIRTNRITYLKRHHKFKATLEGAEILCQKILSARDAT